MRRAKALATFLPFVALALLTGCEKVPPGYVDRVTLDRLEDRWPLDKPLDDIGLVIQVCRHTRGDTRLFGPAVLLNEAGSITGTDLKPAGLTPSGQSVFENELIMSLPSELVSIDVMEAYTSTSYYQARNYFFEVPKLLPLNPSTAWTPWDVPRQMSSDQDTKADMYRQGHVLKKTFVPDGESPRMRFHLIHGRRSSSAKKFPSEFADC